MKTFKKRHQLFLPELLSRRLEVIARNSGRARSEILVEALEAWLERRGAPDMSETVLVRLNRIERTLLRLGGNGDLLWEAMSRLVRHQLITAASLPPVTEAAQLIGNKAHQAFLAEVAERREAIDLPQASSRET